MIREREISIGKMIWAGAFILRDAVAHSVLIEMHVWGRSTKVSNG
jgi:hypothetical protein